MTTQAEKAAQFRALHQGSGAFVIANAWDAGSARILGELGFRALATSNEAPPQTDKAWTVRPSVNGRREAPVAGTQGAGDPPRFYDDRQAVGWSWRTPDDRSQ